jgi:cytochrome c-type biogenesis protein CcmH
MTLWLIFLAMVALAVVMLALPLLRPARDGAGRVDYDVTLYRGQLDEIDRDLARGVMAPADVAAARAEIGRRLLAAAERRERRTPTSVMTRRMVAVVLAALVPLAALALYVNLGAPMVPDQPFAARQGKPGAGTELAALEARIAELSAKVKANPNDIDSWSELGHLYTAHERYREAADALGRAYELSGKAPVRAVDFAEALVLADRGVVGAEAKKLFGAALAADPHNPRAHFYLGLGRVQTGDARGGLEEWLELEADSPAEAPWLATLTERIGEVAKDNNIDAAQLDAMRSAARARVAARNKATETADKGAGAIVGQETPAKPEGGSAAAPAGPAKPADTAGQAAATEPDKAQASDKTASDKAAADKPAATPAPGKAASPGAGAPPGPSESDIEAAQGMKKEDQVAMIRGMVDRLAARLKTEPNDLNGWRRLGSSYLVLGEPDKASDAYAHAAALAPKNIDVLLDYGEALLTAAGPQKSPTDRLPPKFIEVMRQVYALDDHNPVALWYLGVDHLQNGRRAEAAALWQRLLERLPPNAPERAALAKRLEMLKIDRKPEQ